MIVPDCRCVCNSGSSLAVITDSSLTSLRSSLLRRSLPICRFDPDDLQATQQRCRTRAAALPLTTTSTTSYWPLRSLTALLPVFHPTSIHPRIPPAPSFTIRDPTSNGVAALQEAVSLHHRPLFERFWFIVGSHPSQPGPVVSESVDTGYCPGLTFLCVSVHVVDNRTLYRENAVKIMIEGVFNHWIMHHSVQR